MARWIDGGERERLLEVHKNNYPGSCNAVSETGDSVSTVRRKQTSESCPLTSMAHNTSIHTQVTFENMTEWLVPILSHTYAIGRKKKLLRPELISKEKSNMNSECPRSHLFKDIHIIKKLMVQAQYRNC